MRICPLILIAFGVVGSTALYSQDYRSPLILSPYSVLAGGVLVGKTGSPQPVSLVNTGLNVVHISGIAITGNFSQTNDCPAPSAGLTHDQSCTVQITFKPTALGSSSGTLRVTHDAPGGPLTVSLSGTGTLGAPGVAISPSSLAFPEQAQGTTSLPQTATLKNSGEKVLFLSGVTVDGNFNIMPDSTCEKLDGPLTPGSNCTIVVTFAPLGAGKGDGNVTITDDAEDSPQKISLSGIGKQ